MPGKAWGNVRFGPMYKILVTEDLACTVLRLKVKPKPLLDWSSYHAESKLQKSF